jgi:hypothetical protein
MEDDLKKIRRRLKQNFEWKTTLTKMEDKLTKNENGRHPEKNKNVRQNQ